MTHLIYCHAIFMGVFVIIMSLYSVNLGMKVTTMTPYLYSIVGLYICISFI